MGIYSILESWESKRKLCGCTCAVDPYSFNLTGPTSRCPFLTTTTADHMKMWDAKPLALLFYYEKWRQGYQSMKIYSPKTIIYSNSNQRTRFIPETESPELFLTGFAGLIGVIVKRPNMEKGVQR